MEFIERRKTCRALQYDGKNGDAIAELTGQPRLAERMSVGMYAVVLADGTVRREPESSFERDWQPVEAPKAAAASKPAKKATKKATKTSK